MVQAGGWRLRTLGAHPASGGGHALVPTTFGGDERTLGAHLAWWRLGKGGGAEDAGGASGLGGDTRSYRATCLSDLTAHIKSPARAEHPSVPSDSHMDISSSSQSSENSLDQLLSSEHIKKII